VRIEAIPSTSPEYPPALHDLSNPPAVLWMAGDRCMLTEPIVAVVGTRRSTAYGQRIARELVTALARAGACVVSGMAFGIDAAAHQAALDAGGRTIAVLGTGVDVPYPRGNLALYREIAHKGLFLSEMPPGAPCHRGSFVGRNRIIAALAAVTFVIEAPVKSGALSTVEAALMLGRDIGVVPGAIDSPQSAGSNRLLQQGAHPIVEIDDALMLAGLDPPPHAKPDLSDPVETRIWNALADGAASLDELCARSAMPAAECLAAVTALELRGVVECALTGEVRRR
jgi:DNA processing protein